MKKVLVVAPHPDDETLGCGGTLLKHKDNGDLLYWLIVTSSKKSSKGICSKIKKRQSEIKQVSDAYGFSQTIELNLPTTLLDTIPKSEIIKSQLLINLILFFTHLSFFLNHFLKFLFVGPTLNDPFLSLTVLIM